MKVVVISPRFPYPLEKGDKLRLYHQLKLLSEKCEIILVSLTEVDIEDAHFKNISAFVSKIHIFRLSKLGIIKRLLLGAFNTKPFQVLYFFDKNIKRKIERIIQDEKPDVIYNQLIRTTEYTKSINGFKVLDYMDSFSTGMKKRQLNSSFPLRILWKMEYKRLKNYESYIFNYFNRHSIISDQDRLAFNKYINDSIEVIPNGVDVEFFKTTNSPKKYDLVFVGNMGYYPNVTAAIFLVKKILPILKQKYPDIKIMLAGARPDKKVLALESENVKISGWVEDIRTAYDESKIFIAPIFAGIGQQNKILEAMSMQIPVITSSTVNAAIGGKSGENLLLADTAEEFAKHIFNLLENNDFSNRLGESGREFVENKYSWKYQFQKLFKLFEK